MSDIRHVARDTKFANHTMSIEAVNEARGWLEWLTEREHRGRHDTWTAARDRAAKKAGLSESYAKRLWDRWDSMKDVSGGAYRALSVAYHKQCDRNLAAAAHYRALAEEVRNGRETDGDSFREAARLDGVSDRASAPSPSPLP